jgi:predicted protein tyrosine phosphatase
VLITNPADASSGTLPQSWLEVLPLARRVLHLMFPDYEKPRYGAALVAPEDVRRAMDWSTGSTDLVVSCTLGRSRSAALAYVLRCVNCPPQEAIKILDPNWHRPNRLVVLHGARLLRTPAVFTVFDGWRDEK